MLLGKRLERKSYEYWYMVIMVIYMAQMTDDTGRMIGGLSGNLFPLLFPIIATYILLRRNTISFKSTQLIKVLAVATIWSFAILLKYQDLSTACISYIIFMYYYIFIAFIHIKVYNDKLFVVYEDIMVSFAKITFFLWSFSVIFPSLAALFFHAFPETSYGNNFLYLFNWMDPSKGQYYSGIMRNAGFSWEPGRFAIMVTLAIFCNLCRNGIKFRANKNIWWLIAALLTTQSTTGISVALIIYLCAVAQDFSPKKIFVTILIMLPIIIGVMQLDFMSDKIEDRLEINSSNDNFYKSELYHSKSGVDVERHVSLDRFQSMYFEWINFTEDIFLGYSRDVSKSWFGKTFISDYSLTGGLVKVLSQFGLLFGLIIYIWLYKSSLMVSRNFGAHMPLALFLSMIFSSVSYPIWGIPVFTSFWMYGIFSPINKSISNKRNL